MAPTALAWSQWRAASALGEGAWEPGIPCRIVGLAVLFKLPVHGLHSGQRRVPGTPRASLLRHVIEESKSTRYRVAWPLAANGSRLGPVSPRKVAGLPTPPSIVPSFVMSGHKIVDTRQRRDHLHIDILSTINLETNSTRPLSSKHCLKCRPRRSTINVLGTANLVASVTRHRTGRVGGLEGHLGSPTMREEKGNILCHTCAAASRTPGSLCNSRRGLPGSARSPASAQHNERGRTPSASSDGGGVE